MAKMIGVLLACMLLLAVTGAWASGVRNVVVVSIDALHPDALNETNAPLTWRLLQKGSLTLRGQSTNPPKTLISHSAMMTGVGPENGGRTSNDWAEGEPTVQGGTLFHLAKRHGFRTGFFYSKPKLGFLVNDHVDSTMLSPDDAIGSAVRFLENGERSFVFIHVSGLDIVGPQYGWLSQMYVEELSYIDQYLDELYTYLERTGSFVLVVTSDHAGYGKAHGGDHPEEARLPFGVVSDRCTFSDMAGAPYVVTQLPAFIERVMECGR